MSRFLFCGLPPGTAICEKPELVRERDFVSLCLRSCILSSFSPFACGFQTAASSRQCATDGLENLEPKEMGSVEQLAAKGLQRWSILPVSASSGKGTQVPCFRAQAKPKPGVFFFALVSCCAECIAIWTATASIAGQACSAQEVESHLHRRGNEAMDGHSDLRAPVATVPRGRSTAQQIESAKEEEKKTQDSIERMSRHVAEVCEKIEAAKARRAVVQTTLSLSRQKKKALATGLGYRRRGYSFVRPFLCHPSCCLSRLDTCPLFDSCANGNGNAPVQAPASLGQRDFGCRAAGQRG